MNTRNRRLTAAAAVVAAVLVLTLGFGLIVGGVLLAGVVGGGGCGGDGGPGGGSARIGPRTWSGEQTANAQLITSVVIGRGLPRRAAVIAVAVAIAESGLRNLTSGDRDSLGLFQQRPSQGWGTPARILTPALATATFLDHLLALPGWATLPAGAAGQLVQRSAFPDAYAPNENPAADLVARFWTGPDTPLPALGGRPAQLAGFALTGCADQGRSDLPLGPDGLGARAMPPGYQLPTDPAARAAVGYAVAQLGKPYVWGATGPAGFDCSGLVQAAWAAGGVGISRTTTTQVHDGTPIVGLDQIAPGDLLFIPGADGTPTHPGHVGIYAGSVNGQGLVIDAYDTREGVIVEHLTAWTPKIASIRRVAQQHPTPAPAARPGPALLADGPTR